MEFLIRIDKTNLAFFHKGNCKIGELYDYVFLPDQRNGCQGSQDDENTEENNFSRHDFLQRGVQLAAQVDRVVAHVMEKYRKKCAECAGERP